MTIRVVLADDQDLVRSGIAMLLSAQPDVEVVGEARDGLEAVELAHQLLPDVVIMDVNMPNLDGVEATRRIANDTFGPDQDTIVKVLILTTSATEETVHNALLAGASGFILKDRAPRALVTALRAVADGDAWLDPSVTGYVIANVASRPTVPNPGLLDRLTQREREVLELMAYGLSNAEIAARLVITEGTVKTHVSRIIMKMDVRDRTQAVVAAYQNGLVSIGGSPDQR